MPKHRPSGPTLFDLNPKPEPRFDLARHCQPRCTQFDKTLHIWPGETQERLTSTCRECGTVYGRFY